MTRVMIFSRKFQNKNSMMTVIIKLTFDVILSDGSLAVETNVACIQPFNAITKTLKIKSQYIFKVRKQNLICQYIRITQSKTSYNRLSFSKSSVKIFNHRNTLKNPIGVKITDQI